MGRRGPQRRLDLEAQYWQLLAQGIGTKEACRRLGIGRKTGYRWRAESGGIVPAALADGPRHGHHLSRLERHRIATLRREGLTIREVARQLRRAPSTISRELARNTEPWDRAYDGDLAHSRARYRAQRRRPTKLATDAVLRALVTAKLELQWSPEQIAAHLREHHPHRPDWHLCHESIYRALYRGGTGGLARTMVCHLRCRRPLRKPRRGLAARVPRFISTGALIDTRPAVVDQRSRVGDWEGDLIIGTGSRSAILTLVERRTRLLKLVHLPTIVEGRTDGLGGHSADAVSQALKAALASVPRAARLTLTWDQGSEMADHHRVAEHFTEGVYFAHAGAPWERGSNENANGLLRQYFPKYTDLSVHSPARLADVERRLNERPRKQLGWKTPAELFAAHLATEADGVHSLTPVTPV